MWEGNLHPSSWNMNFTPQVDSHHHYIMSEGTFFKLCTRLSACHLYKCRKVNTCAVMKCILLQSASLYYGNGGCSFFLEMNAKLARMRMSTHKKEISLFTMEKIEIKMQKLGWRSTVKLAMISTELLTKRKTSNQLLIKW